MPPSTLDPGSTTNASPLPAPSAEIHAWLAGEFSNRLAEVFETMAGERPRIESEDLPEPPVETGLAWSQGFTGLKGSLWIFATEPDWMAAGQLVLRAAGLEESDAGTARSTYLETIGQAVSGLAQSVSGRLQREVAAEAGAESQLSAETETKWIALRLSFGAQAAVIAAGFEAAFLDALAGEEASVQDAAVKEMAAQARAGSEGSASRASGLSNIAAPPGSKTFDLLLDVELPVSVSFGRAQIPLKDVLKLTTGSIVELNRAISEPVEIIVNNCVIARGEVVVIEGNFGVRIQQVLSRQERLRTLS